MTSSDSACLTRPPRYQPRRFVPEGVNFSDESQVVELYSQLLEREVDSAESLEGWLLDRSELEAALDEEGSVLYVNMTCQTDDAERAAAYQHFVEKVVPAVKPIDNQLDKKYHKLRQQYQLNEKRYEVFDRNVETDLALFRSDNVPLQTQESLLSQKYQTLIGGMMVSFEGQERTLPEMQKYLLQTDRPLREAAWRATAERRLQDKDELESIYDQMLALRVKIAANAGFDNYEKYKFRSMHRFDYDISDCEAYHQAIERRVVPLWSELLRQRRESMQLESLRPWDTSVDPLGRPPLRPFEQPKELVDGTARIFRRVDPALGRQFETMISDGLLDLASRKGKAPGGYQTTLSEARKPFIFMNAVGLERDVRTLLHEGGHAFHSLAAADEPLLGYRHGPMEFCEVASMGMELLGDDFLDEFYNEDDLKRSRREHFEGVIFILPWVATIDAFQQWIYANPQHDREARRQAWLACLDRFGGGVVDWTGLEAERGHMWHRQLHIFEVPFYYIEYGIAQLGALQLWVRARREGRAAALAGYRRALALGGSRPLPELFAAAGLKFDFSESTIAPLMDEVAEELQKL